MRALQEKPEGYDERRQGGENRAPRPNGPRPGGNGGNCGPRPNGPRRHRRDDRRDDE